MTTQEALALEKECAELFAGLRGGNIEIHMMPSRDLKIRFNNNAIVFDSDTGEASYICFNGSLYHLYDALKEVKRTVLIPANKKKLALLKWSYDHRKELTD